MVKKLRSYLPLLVRSKVPSLWARQGKVKLLHLHYEQGWPDQAGADPGDARP